MKRSPKLNRIAILLALALVLPIGLSACRSEPPALEDVRDRFEELIEASAEINDIFFGDGLATYERTAEYEQIYYGFYGYDAYEIVAFECPYQSVEQIKAAAEKVYTADYLSDIYTMAFDGYADETSDAVTTARYLHTGEYFLRYDLGETDPFDLLPGKRIYKYDTMRIGPLSNAKAVNLEIETYLEGDEQNVTLESLRFVLVDDEWFLDEPTY